ncbi:S-layer protein [Flavobacterium psychrophilum]|nr:hypothetical protein [Flavobacterium psychrophilum]AIJ37528.1 S-layer protein [Flavobacterium psychrophilum]
MHEVNVIKNTEVIFYMRNEKNELIGINKNVSSKINMILEANNIETITFFTDVEGIIYPEEELPENARKLKGFIWRGDEQILTKEDLFPKEELELDAKAQKESKAKSKDINIPMQPSQETLEYDKQNVEKKVGKKKKK